MNHWPAYIIEVDLNQVRHNVKEIRRRIGSEVTLMLVVKVDAYGHGAPAVARAVLEAGQSSWVWPVWTWPPPCGWLGSPAPS